MLAVILLIPFVKVAFTDMKADANEVSIETLELATEEITVEYK